MREVNSLGSPSEKIQALFSRLNPSTAIFPINDMFAIGACASAKNMG
ncbi:MAG: hypothetical protein AAGD96_08800 [Chloroflexota bacterium]